MKNHLPALKFAALFGLLVSMVGTPASYAQSRDLNFEEETFVRLPALEFTIATVALDKYLIGVPRDFTRTERAFSQVRPGVTYDQGMVWLTFKYGGKRGLLSQIRKFRITKKVRSSWRLSSTPSWRIEKSASAEDYAFAESSDAAPAPRHVGVPVRMVSAMALTEIAPGALTVDRRSA